jgi:hypothetical protein
VPTGSARVGVGSKLVTWLGGPVCGVRDRTRHDEDGTETSLERVAAEAEAITPSKASSPRCMMGGWDAPPMALEHR